MSSNVLIPMDILKKTVELLRYWDISKFDRVIQDDYHDIMFVMTTKMKKIELRAAYSKVVKAKNEDARHSARMEYLWQRNQIASLESTHDYDV